MKRISRKSIVYIVSGVLAAASLVMASVSLPLAFIAGVLCILLMGFGSFENSNVLVERIVLIAILSAVSAAGRVLFSSIPGANPSSFLIIMAAAVFGPSSGFMIGALTALVSNMLLGHGPWTLWQMALWGLMGFASGYLGTFLKKKMWITSVYGMIWGFLFGWIMNLFHVYSGYIVEQSFTAFLLACAASFVFDLLHAAGNMFLILLLGPAFLKIFERASLKYGLRE